MQNEQDTLSAVLKVFWGGDL